MKQKTRVILGVSGGVAGILLIGGVFYLFAGESSQSADSENQSPTEEQNNSVITETNTIEGTRKSTPQQSSSSDEDTTSDGSQPENGGAQTDREQLSSSYSGGSDSNTEQRASASVVSPSGPQVWRSGTTHTLQWQNIESVERVSIQLTPSNHSCGQNQACTSTVNSNAARYTLADNVANTGTFEWKIPPLNGRRRTEGTYVFLITRSDGESVLGTSPPVALQSPSTQSNITLVSPNDFTTSRVKAGEVLLLRWGNSADVFQVDITLTRVSCGEARCSSRFETHSIAQGKQNSRMHSWHIPQEIDQGTYRVIVRKPDGQAQDSGLVEITTD